MLFVSMIDLNTAFAILAPPPPQFTVAQWADQYRMLSSEASAEPGRWRTDRAEYQRGIMDAITDPLVENVVVMTSSQVGKTEIINNCIGYYIAHDPAPMLLVQPTLEMAEAFSKDRLAPMLRDTPALRGKIRDARSRDSANRVLHKQFPGGHITLSGANSPASLASRPVRIVFCDEVDRYGESAGTEGDPVDLAIKRSTTFWNRKHLLTSTPTIKGVSRIEAAYLASDQRKYEARCPLCGTFQVLRWAHVRWPDGKPKEAAYRCEQCEQAWTEMNRHVAIRGGRWRATATFEGTAGFWINELYSPWVPIPRMVASFLKAKVLPEMLRVFVNTSLGETWEEAPGEVLSEQTLASRREQYGPAIPACAAVLTAGVDVQDTRIEAELKAWGKGEECWGIEHKIFHGDTTDPQAGAWKSLDDWLQGEWRHDSGVPLTIACAMIDSGFRTREVYAFVKPRQMRRIFASKGMQDRGKPLVGRPTVSNMAKVKLFPIGTDTAKATIMSRLKKTEIGRGYFHFPESYDTEYFLQLTAEKRTVAFRKGFAFTEWVKLRPRNEALDLTVLNLAALAVLNANLDRLVDELAKRAEAIRHDPSVAAIVARRPFDAAPHRRIISRGIEE